MTAPVWTDTVGLRLRLTSDPKAYYFLDVDEKYAPIVEPILARFIALPPFAAVRVESPRGWYIPTERVAFVTDFLNNFARIFADGKAVIGKDGQHHAIVNPKYTTIYWISEIEYMLLNLLTTPTTEEGKKLRASIATDDTYYDEEADPALLEMETAYLKMLPRPPQRGDLLKHAHVLYRNHMTYIYEQNKFVELNGDIDDDGSVLSTFTVPDPYPLEYWKGSIDHNSIVFLHPTFIQQMVVDPTAPRLMSKEDVDIEGTYQLAFQWIAPPDMVGGGKIYHLYALSNKPITPEAVKAQLAKSANVEAYNEDTVYMTMY